MKANQNVSQKSTLYRLESGKLEKSPGFLFTRSEFLIPTSAKSFFPLESSWDRIEGVSYKLMEKL